MKFFFFKRRKRVAKAEEPAGYHDLISIYQEINTRYFKGEIDIPIGWFGSRVPTAKRKVLLGTYHLDKKCIKINRVLDHPYVPRYYISFIVYHEMLHHLFPPIISKSKRKIHHPQFKEEEKRFSHYNQATLFGQKNKKLWFCL